MKYMIMTFGDQSALAGRPPEWMKNMVAFMKQIDADLSSSGELVYQQGLADPSQAKTITAPGERPVVTGGPVAAPGDSLAGFWIVDVASEARAIEIAGQITGMTEAPAEVRPVRRRTTGALKDLHAQKTSGIFTPARKSAHPPC